MKVIDVIPIAKGIFNEKLSYFTAKEAPIGSLVQIPIKKRTVPAIVTASIEAKEVKTLLKNSDFSMKSVKSVLSPSFLTPEFILACKDIAKYYLSTHGSVLRDFIPQAVLDGDMNVSKSGPSDEEKNADSENNKNKTASPQPAQTKMINEVLAIQSPQIDRMQYYRSLVREEFAKNHSVFICFPAASDAAASFNDLQKGIEKYAYILNSKIPKKAIKETWRMAFSEKHPVLIVGTRSFLSIPRNDLGTIILDGESSSFYKNQKQPYLDARKAAEIICKRLKARLILGDNILRAETYYKQESGEFILAMAHNARALSSVDQILADTKEDRETGWQNKKFSAISGKLYSEMFKALEDDEKIILFVNRKGHSPITLCSDCQRAILCSKCDSPMVLHKNSESGKSVYICHKCLDQGAVSDRCPYCGSWRLAPLGIGAQRVAEEVSKLFPGVKIFEMDGDTIKNDKQGREIAENFFASSCSVLVGTEAIFSYINKPVDLAAIISVDAFFAIPEFRISEKVFHMLMKIKSLVKKKFLIQTRFPQNPIFEHVMRGNMTGFYKEEVENRKKFGYPPFKLIIKLTREGKNISQIEKESEALEKILSEWNPISYKAFVSKIRNSHIRHILIKIDPHKWPAIQNEENRLYKILSSLSPIWKINIDPDSLL